MAYIGCLLRIPSQTRETGLTSDKKEGAVGNMISDFPLMTARSCRPGIDFGSCLGSAYSSAPSDGSRCRASIIAVPCPSSFTLEFPDTKSRGTGGLTGIPLPVRPAMAHKRSANSSASWILAVQGLSTVVKAVWCQWFQGAQNSTSHRKP